MKHCAQEKLTECFFVNKIFKRMMLPSLISALCMSIGGIADAVVVGANMGEVGLAAISYSYPIYMLYNVIAIGLSSGAAIAYSKALGEGKKEEGVGIFGTSLTFLLLGGVAIAAVGFFASGAMVQMLGAKPAQQVVFAAAKEYATVLLIGGGAMFLQMLFYHFLMNDDVPQLANIGMLAGNILDIVLNLVLVLGFQMGAQGAALATIIGALLSDLIFLPHFFRKDSTLKLRLTPICWRKIFESYRVGMAYTSQSVYQMITITMMNHILGGLYGTFGVAMYEVLLNCRTIVLTLLESIGETLRVLVSTFFAERSSGNIRRTMRLCAMVATGVTAVTMLMGLFAPHLICALFGFDAQNIDPVRIYAISLPFFAFNVLMTFYYQTVERERIAYTITIFQALILQVLLALLYLQFAPKSIWWLFVAVELGTVFCWLPLVLRGRDWLQLPWQEDGRVLAISLEGSGAPLAEALEQTEEFCAQWDADDRRLYFVTMAIEEICVAIYNSKASGNEGCNIQITVISELEGSFTLHIRDSAEQFNPFTLGEKALPTDEPDLDSVGMQVIRKKALMFNYRHYQGFNTLVLRI